MGVRARWAGVLGLLLSAAWLSAAPVGQASVAPPRAAPLVRVADEVAREVEQLRGWTFKRPVRKERIPVARARQDIRRMLLASDKPQHRARVQAFLRVAGLIPPDCDLIATSLAVLDQQVAGYYEPATRTLRLVDRPNPMPPFVERMILSHELTHALDDQYLDLASLMNPANGTEDTDFVATAIGEGSATSLMLQYMAASQRSGLFSLADLSQYMAEELERVRTLEQLPRYFSAMFGSYIVGAAFLGRGELTTILTQPDNRAIGEALVTARRALPRSSEQLLHAEKYWDPAQRDEPIVFDDRAMALWLDRPGRRIVHRDTLGELLTAILTAPRDTPRDLTMLQSVGAWTNVGAAGWGGDRFFLMASRSGPDALRTTRGLQAVWMTAWDTPKDRDEFLSALEKGSPPPNSTAVALGRQLAVVFMAIGEAERESLLRRLTVLPLAMTRGGRAWKQ
jgi:nitroreductase